MAITNNFKEEAKNSIIEAGNILVREAERIVADIDDEKVSEVCIYMRVCPSEAPELEISKRYAAV